MKIAVDLDVSLVGWLLSHAADAGISPNEMLARVLREGQALRPHTLSCWTLAAVDFDKVYTYTDLVKSIVRKG